MKEILLTQGKVALVDDEDFEKLNKVNWCFHSGYARRRGSINGEQMGIHMHRVVNKTPDGLQTDHINGNKLDNRKLNLRTATQSNNQHNRTKYACNKSGFKGVYFHKHCKRYQARIRIHTKLLNLGFFLTPEAAHAAYCEAAEKLHGDFARTV